MTFLTRNTVTFGSVVRHNATGLHFLVVGWLNENRLAAVCERPGCNPVLIHRDCLQVVKPARRWASRARS